MIVCLGFGHFNLFIFSLTAKLKKSANGASIL